MKTALFIGRFQPFHAGHLSVLQQMAEDGIDRVIIGVGSSQYHGTAENPLTYEERRDLIDTVLMQYLDTPPRDVVAIPDIHAPEQWVAHVDTLLEEAGLSYTVVYTGNPEVAELFENAGATVQTITPTIDVSASAVRESICNGTDEWKTDIDQSVQNRVQQGVQKHCQ